MAHRAAGGRNLTVTQETTSPAAHGPGDKSSDFAVFYADAGPKLRAKVRLLVDRDDEAHDLLQDAMLVAYRAWPRLRDRSFGERFNYVYLTMVRNAARVSQRERSLRRLVDKLARQGSGNPERDDHVEATVLDSVRAAEALQMVERLPRRQRVVMTLLWDGLSIGEVAKFMGLSESGVRSHLQHARATLKRYLDTKGGTNA
jgi:RNA polymerase sigma factor (sigma-70 family)